MDNPVKKDLIEKLKKARNPEELVSIAKENGIKVTKEAAQCYFCRQLRESELSDKELNKVVGGQEDNSAPDIDSGYKHYPVIDYSFGYGHNYGLDFWLSIPCSNFCSSEGTISCDVCFNRSPLPVPALNGLKCCNEKHD